MVVLVSCKNEDPIKHEGARVLTSLYIDFYRFSRAANPAVRGRILPKFQIIQAFMVVIVTKKKEEVSIKNEGTRVLTTFLPL